MPYKSRKVRNKNCYKVYKNDKTKKVFAKCATKENAQRQMRLLRAIQNNKNFKPNARRNMGGKSRKNKTLKIKGGFTNRPGHNFINVAPPPPLRSNDYIELPYGNLVNIIDIRGNSFRRLQHSLNSSIRGIIISVGINNGEFYHMFVTSGNNEIIAGTNLYLPTILYNRESHRPIIELAFEESKIENPDSSPNSPVA